MLRDRAITLLIKRIYSILSFGWSGRAKDWHVLRRFLSSSWFSYPLVLSVHTLYRWTLLLCIPGWHTTISLLTVAGAVFSGFAMENTLLIIMRKYLI
jgi:molybdopterin-containing oxidoreductase family membrane subunit